MTLFTIDEAAFSLPENSTEKMRICEVLTEESAVDEAQADAAVFLSNLYNSRIAKFNPYGRRRFMGKKKL